MATLTRKQYYDLYGPTTGDIIGIGTYKMWVEIEKDHTTYGEEIVPGLTGNVGSGMAQSDYPPNHPGVADMIIANVVIIDHALGIIKADIGVKDGLISGIGKSGNPDVQDGVTPGLIIGPSTAVYNGAGMFATAGTVDALATNINAGALSAALAAGTTTVIGHCTGMTASFSGSFPYGGNNGIKDTLQAIDSSVVNVALLAQGCTATGTSQEENLRAGAAGLCLPSGRGVFPAVIDHALSVAESHDVPVVMGTDAMNQSGYAADTLAAINGRTAILMDPGGFLGGHPHGITLLNAKNILGLSTATTRTVNTIESFSPENLYEMAFQIHGATDTDGPVSALMNELVNVRTKTYVPDPKNPDIKRITSSGTFAAEDILIYSGQIGMIGSGPGQLYGRDAALPALWKTAAALWEEHHTPVHNHNIHILHCIRAYTINPAIAFGIADHVGSLEAGKRADIVLWEFNRFGDQPEMVFSGGSLAYSATAQLGATGQLPYVPASSPANGLRFVSRLAADDNIGEKYGLSSNIVAVKNTRNITQETLKLQYTNRVIEFDTETLDVSINGRKAEYDIFQDFRIYLEEDKPDPRFKLAEGLIELNAGKEELRLAVISMGDRPISVSSHFNFAEVNVSLDCDRNLAQGYRLNIPAGTILRIDPGKRYIIDPAYPDKDYRLYLIPISGGRGNDNQ